MTMFWCAPASPKRNSVTTMYNLGYNQELGGVEHPPVLPKPPLAAAERARAREREREPRRERTNERTFGTARTQPNLTNPEPDTKPDQYAQNTASIGIRAPCRLSGPGLWQRERERDSPPPLLLHARVSLCVCRHGVRACMCWAFGLVRIIKCHRCSVVCPGGRICVSGGTRSHVEFGGV